MLDILIGLAASCAIAVAGWRAGALSASGLLGTVLVGTTVYAAGGVGWAAVLVGFFVLSSSLSRVGAGRKARMSDVTVKGSRRDILQVLANGGLATLLALLAIWPFGPEAIFPLFVAAMAAVNADTWSTEIGSLSPETPRSIVNGRSVPPGTSGGVTLLGLAAALVGGLTLGIIGWVVADEPSLVLVGALAGLVGSVADSLIGATIQRVYRCPVCNVGTEQTVHLRCGTRTEPSSGWGWVDNDAVNFAASLSGAATGLVVAWIVL